MKKIIAIFLSMIIITASFAGCGGTDGGSQESAETTEETGVEDNASETTGEETEPLIVAVQNFYCSSVVGEIMNDNMAEEFDCPFEIVVFDGGAAINEAIGEWDIAVTGGAFIYALANYDCKLIAHQVDGSGDDCIVARKGDPILDCLGDKEAMAECVRGKTLLTNVGTTGHYVMVLWLESLGVSPNEVNLISQSFDNVFASWQAGEADYAILTSPYCYQYGEETVSLGTLEDFGGTLMESTVCTADAYNNKYDQVVKFTAMLMEASDKLKADPDLAFNTVKEWYANYAQEKTDEEILGELEAKPFYSLDEYEDMDLTEFATYFGSYYASQNLIEPDRVEVITENCANDVRLDALELLGR